ncbi:hypothetical protein MJO29_002228 [Puccinia striiformis f. sp. tritici]|nr:hypothetical protein MJO29_002228 [Puccinia striiformis f. sp. tritici]
MTDSMDVDAKSVAKPDGDANSSDQKRFVVKKWNAVALWAWDIVVDNCAICRNHIMDLCEALGRVSYRMSSQSSQYDQRGMYGCVGDLQPRVSLPLHLKVVENSSSLSARQSRMGTSKVWPIRGAKFAKFTDDDTFLISNWISIYNLTRLLFFKILTVAPLKTIDVMYQCIQ